METVLFRIALIGEAPMSETYVAHFSEIFSSLRKQFSESGETDFQYIYDGTSLPSVWEKICKDNGISEFRLPLVEESAIDSTEIPGLEKKKLVILSDLADLTLGFWDENPDGKENNIWETIHRCTEKKVPCIWISKKDGNIYWAEDSLFMPFNIDVLTEHYKVYSVCEHSEAEPKPLKFGERLLDFGAKKFTRLIFHRSAVCLEPEPPDVLMDTPLPQPKAEKIRSELLSLYEKYDSRAVIYGNRYRGVLFWRAILPVLSTILLAIAFYATGLPLDLWISDEKLLSINNSLLLISGIAFVIQAFLFLFSHWISHWKVVKNWKINYQYNRIMAETSRFCIHVLPFGITMPINRLVQGTNDTSSEESFGKAIIWRMLHGLPLADYNESDIPNYFIYLKAYIKSQIFYHKRNATRYKDIYNHLEKLEKAFVALGFVTTIIRAAFQLVRFWAEPLKGWGSVANMGVMIITAISGYYSSKLALCGYDDIYSSDKEMEERLTHALRLIENMEGRELNYSMVRKLTEQIGVLLMGEVSQWNDEMAGRKLKGL